MSIVHFLLDWETLDTRPEAVVLSCNIMQFDPATDTAHEQLQLTFAAELIEEQLNAGRTVSSSTLEFWMVQGLKAREGLYEGTRLYPMHVALRELTKFVSGTMVTAQAEDARIWGNGADFDVAILNSLCKQFEVPSPFRYNSSRCARTVMAAYPDLKVRAPTGLAHHPYYDNLAMVQSLSAVYKVNQQLFN